MLSPARSVADPGSGVARNAVDHSRLTDYRMHNMVCHMKTTLNIADSVMRRLKREAARQGRTMSEMVETALRRLLETRQEPTELPPLPELHSGGHLIDIANRESLYEAMEKR